MTPRSVCEALLEAVARQDWDRVASLLDPAALAEWQRQELAGACSWFEVLKEERRTGVRVQGFLFSDGTPDPGALARFGGTVIAGLPGRPTLGELAAEAPVAFLRRCATGWPDASQPLTESAPLSFEVLDEHIIGDRAQVRARLHAEPEQEDGGETDEEDGAVSFGLRLIGDSWRVCLGAELQLLLPSLWFRMPDARSADPPA